MKATRLTALMPLALGAILAMAPSAGAASGAACQVSGTADFGSNPLKTGSNGIDLGFTNTTLTCPGSTPGSGTILGGTYTVGGKSYTVPRIKGSGNCTSNSSNGLLIVRWSDTTFTVLNVTSQPGPSAAELSYTGATVASVNLSPVNP